jgi:hypothetical protein
MALDLATRMLVEWALKAAGTTLPQQSREPQSWDSTSLPYKLKLPSRPYREDELEPFVTVHVSDVIDGFGVSKARDKFWDKNGPILPGATSFESALLERYRGVAYHWIGSRRLGAVRNHPATLRTSHGNAGNKGMGWALDCGHREAIGPELAVAGHRSLSGCILEAHEATGEVVAVVAHAVWSKKRLVDTDAGPWHAVVLPVVEALGPSVCRVDYDVCDRKAGGKPLSELKWAR